MVSRNGDASRRDESTRERLIQAAADMFVEVGFDGARVQDISRRAGLTTGAIYANFRSKGELLYEVVTRIGQTDTSGERREGEDLGVLDVISWYLDPRNERERLLLFETFVAARRHPNVRKIVRAALHKRQKDARRAVECSQEWGTVDPSLDPEIVGQMIQALALGALTAEAAGARPVDPERWRETLAAISGLYRPAPERRPEPRRG